MMGGRFGRVWAAALLLALTLAGAAACCDGEGRTDPSLSELRGSAVVPKVLYHGVDPLQMDEFDLVLVMLDLREMAIVSNYSLSVMTSAGVIVADRESFRGALGSADMVERIRLANVRLFDAMRAEGLVDYLVDYGHTDVPVLKQQTVLSGEGYVALPPEQVEEYRRLFPDAPLPPTWKAEPNGLKYKLSGYPRSYPMFYRANVYSTEHLSIAQLFGPIVLELADRRHRGLSLPRLAERRHGPLFLLGERALSYNGVTNHDEYVWPGYISSRDVVAAYVQDNPYRKREYGNTIARKYTRRYVDGRPVLTVTTTQGRVLLQAASDGGRIVFKKQRHPRLGGPDSSELDRVIEQILEYNARRVRNP